MPHPVAIAEGRVLPGIRPTVLGTLSIELVVVVCAVRVEMACGPGARQPPSSAWVMLRVRASVSFHAADWNTAVRAGLPWCTGVPHAGAGSEFPGL